MGARSRVENQPAKSLFLPDSDQPGRPFPQPRAGKELFCLGDPKLKRRKGQLSAPRPAPPLPVPARVCGQAYALPPPQLAGAPLQEPRSKDRDANIQNVSNEALAPVSPSRGAR